MEQWMTEGCRSDKDMCPKQGTGSGDRGRVYKGPYKEDVLVIKGCYSGRVGGEELDSVAWKGLSGHLGRAAAPRAPPAPEILWDFGIPKVLLIEPPP